MKADERKMKELMQNNDKVKAAIYIRVSTKLDSQGESYEVQRQMLIEEAISNGFEVTQIYEEKKSASKLYGRGAFEEMLKDAKLKKFKAILFKDLSRLARNAEVSHQLRQIALTEEVALHSFTEGYNLEQNFLRYGMLSFCNEEVSRDISRKKKQSVDYKAENGIYFKGEAPYGYERFQDTLRVRDDEIPEVVKKIFNWYNDGNGFCNIAKRLNQAGIQTPSNLTRKLKGGSHWHESSVRYILTNRVYTGALVQLKQSSVGLHSKQRKMNSNPVIIENHHEPIISYELFESVQMLLKSKLWKRQIEEQRHLFTDIAFCGKCGKNYWYRSVAKSYICGTYAAHGKVVCNSESIKELDLIKIINADLKEMIEKLRIEFSVKEALNDKILSGFYKINHLISVLKSKLDNQDKAKGDLIVKRLMGEITEEEFESGKRYITAESEALVQKIKRQTEKQTQYEYLKENDALRMALLDREFIDVTDHLTLNTFVKKIVIHAKDKIEIHYRFKL